MIDRTLAASPAQRLAWLEETIRLAFSTGALPRDDSERYGTGSSRSSAVSPPVGPSASSSTSR